MTIEVVRASLIGQELSKEIAASALNLVRTGKPIKTYLFLRMLIEYGAPCTCIRVRGTDNNSGALIVTSQEQLAVNKQSRDESQWWNRSDEDSPN